MANESTRTQTQAQTVTLLLRVRGGADAIAFYKEAFGATEHGRLAGSDGKIMHAALRIGNSDVMLADESLQFDSPAPDSLGGTSVSIALEVPDVDAVVDRAVAAGARVVFPVADQFYGKRSGRIVDPFGHVWIVGTTIEQVSPEEMERRAAAWAAENLK
jgi:PhnB protein